MKTKIITERFPSWTLANNRRWDLHGLGHKLMIPVREGWVLASHHSKREYHILGPTPGPLTPSTPPTA